MKLPFKIALGMALAIGLVGCSDGNPPVKPGVTVRGKILKGGEALQVPNQAIGVGIVEIVLIPLNPPTGEPERTLAKPDGTFEIVGPGKGLPPGEYKLAVYQRDQGPGSDLLKGAFSEKTTPIKVTLAKEKLNGRVELDPIELETFLQKK